MSLKSAALKFFARGANDKLIAHDVKASQERAYKKTGKQIKQANKEGHYIDGKKAYKANYKRYKSSAIKRGRARAQFINDL